MYKKKKGGAKMRELTAVFFLSNIVFIIISINLVIQTYITYNSKGRFWLILMNSFVALFNLLVAYYNLLRLFN